MTLKTSDQEWHDHVVAVREARKRKVRELEADNWREHQGALYTLDVPVTGPDDAA